MSIWINKLLIRLVAGLALAGCVATAGVEVGGLRIAAPFGYCVDETTGGGAIALIGRCAGQVARPPAVMTVVVGAPGTGGVVAGNGPALAAYFTSAAGRAALARSGQARDVTVLEALGSGDAFLIRLSDVSPGGQGQAEIWRAVLGLQGRLVTLTVNGTAAAPLTRDGGRALMEDFLQAMRTANPGLVASLAEQNLPPA